MKTILISSILVSPNRQRKAFDPASLHEFGDKISSTGLLHPIVLREDHQGGGYAQLVLVAGERRLRAITDLADLGVLIKHDGKQVPLGHIPYTLLEELDELAYEEAELEENIRRQDLSWSERAAAHLRLKELREKQATVAGKPGPTVAEIALEVRGSSEGFNQDTTRQELIVAKHLDNPEVKAAKSVGEAFKILKKQETAAKHRALGVSVGASFTADMHTVLNTDSLLHLQTIPALSFDCIIADPPYGMNADEFGDKGGYTDGVHNYEDNWEYAERCYVALAVEGFRIAKPQAHLYLFCDFDNISLIKAILFAAGWEVFRTPLIWYKKHGYTAPWKELGPQRKYEMIVFASKGKRSTLHLAGDVLEVQPDANLGHMAQKPVELYRELISRTCLPGDSVIDPFCGTGPIFPAAHALRIRATGIELDTASYGIAISRVEELRQQTELNLQLRVA